MAGITPACAGKSSAPFSPTASAWDHPRVCGEKLLLPPPDPPLLGSPPRVRGKATPSFCAVTDTGITPACAGKSGVDFDFYGWQEDHPRVCGEKCMRSKATLQPLGSPPRVRGKVSVNVPIFALQRITPACAGKRPQRGFFQSLQWDHPRVCGEKTTISTGQTANLGSPPRVRGKADALTVYAQDVRITPACAGKSMRRFPSDLLAQGSPPRVRGKVAEDPHMLLQLGITPACAGKSYRGVTNYWRC